ncbi:MAG: hypothetical protein WAK48_30585 [Candidatus Acidiferrum sp.]|jgi:hypothetical protein
MTQEHHEGATGSEESAGFATARRVIYVRGDFVSVPDDLENDAAGIAEVD